MLLSDGRLKVTSFLFFPFLIFLKNSPLFLFFLNERLKLTKYKNRRE